ncbi:MAG TPA: hypothetical protein DD640_01780 [Clostridiales bacterium]|nr:hypothetical protein [Clostridiales bacterium]
MIMLLDVSDSKLKEVMIAFYTLTHIRIAIINTDYHEIIGYPESFSEFCIYMRQNKPSCLACEQSDVQGFEQCKRNGGNINIYKCHAGLTEAAYPLKQDGNIIGYIMFGQVTDIKDRQVFQNSVLSLCRGYAVDQSKLKKALRKQVYKSEEELIAAAVFFEACILYILQKQLISSHSEGLVRRMDQYIKANLDRPLTAHDLARELLVSRTQLYNLVRKYLGVGIAEHVMDIRMNKAVELITKTSLPFAEIAELVGFSDYNYFRRTFHSSKGLSLREFRAQYANKEPPAI